MEDMELTGLETAVAAMFAVFALNEGKNGKLSKAKFLQVVKEELPSFPHEAGEDVFSGVDLNEDGYVDFKEFTLMVAAVAWGHHELLKEFAKALKK